LVKLLIKSAFLKTTACAGHRFLIVTDKVKPAELHAPQAVRQASPSIFEKK